MSRKLGSVVAVLATLGLLTAASVEARPLAAPAVTPSGLAGTLLHWMSSGLATVLNKDGAGFDPNGAKKNERIHQAPGVGKPAERGMGEAR
jgi:hypothetical protein